METSALEWVLDNCGLDDDWSQNWREDGKELVKQARAELAALKAPADAHELAEKLCQELCDAEVLACGVSSAANVIYFTLSEALKEGGGHRAAAWFRAHWADIDRAGIYDRHSVKAALDRELAAPAPQVDAPSDTATMPLQDWGKLVGRAERAEATISELKRLLRELSSAKVRSYNCVQQVACRCCHAHASTWETIQHEPSCDVGAARKASGEPPAGPHPDVETLVQKYRREHSCCDPTACCLDEEMLNRLLTDFAHSIEKASVE